MEDKFRQNKTFKGNDDVFSQEIRKYKNNVCQFRIGDIVRLKDGLRNRYHGEMRVVEIAVAIRNRWSNNMRKYMENHITIVPSCFCSKCTGEDDISFLDVAFNVLEKDIYIVKK